MTLMQLDALVSVESEASVVNAVPEAAAPGDAQSLMGLAAMAGRR